MTSQRWQKIKILFEAASEIAPIKRRKFLENACGDDAELRAEVEKLLDSLEDGKSFMEHPAAREVATLLVEQAEIAPAKTPDAKNGHFVAGTVLANRYRIIGLLGKGGMGEVFQAEDLKLNQTVALKFLPDKLEKDRAALARFHTEVRTARQVSHPNVCRVFDIGEVKNRHFISMEFIDGDDLSSLLRRIGRLPSDKAIEIARQLCFALAAIHEAGILHRDLKPANIIIDSKGKARITDFGIAGLESELKGNAGVVGTPAYMSPEQIAGKELTTKSDLYSLGLVLYEIFTGKQAFQADSIHDLLQKQQTTAPTNPSEVLKEINPLVEKTILHCLEKQPDGRPKNAMQVALMLPGGSPLEAAIAAGETPSPEMVAAAPKKGALRPAVAMACLSAVVILFAFIVLFSGKVKLDGWIPLEKSPEVLAERSASILGKFGYTDTAVDKDYGFSTDAGYFTYAFQLEQTPNPWDKLRTGQPVAIYFWYRTSPRYFSPLEDVIVKQSDPPNEVSGMNEMVLDTRGRLIEFQAVPPQVEDNSAQKNQIDWTTLFTEAGLDIGNCRQTASQWTPPVFSDERIAWEGNLVDHAEIPVRIEAAALSGKPVYFRVVAPWDKPARQEETSSSAPVKAAGVIMAIAFLSIVIAGILLARYNLKRGRGDTRGAAKIALFVFIVAVLGQLIAAKHIPELRGEQLIFYKAIGFSLFNAALIWLIYIALEPYARRRWSDLIISWNRLLAGDFRDPLVGRDVLVGGLLGLCHTATIYLMQVLLPTWLGISTAPNLGTNVLLLQGFKYFFADFLTGVAFCMFNALGGLFFLILLIIILRKERLAIGALWLILFAVLGLAFTSSGHLILWLGPFLIATIMVVCAARFGLLAILSFYIFFDLSFFNPITANVSSWYFGNTIFAAIIIFGLAIYGFYISLAGEPVFKAKLFEENADL